jgi:hypothetical protein
MIAKEPLLLWLARFWMIGGAACILFFLVGVAVVAVLVANSKRRDE